MRPEIDAGCRAIEEEEGGDDDFLTHVFTFLS